MNRFEAYCSTVLHHAPSQIADARERQRQEMALIGQRCLFGNTVDVLPAKAMEIAKATPMTQPDVFWALVSVLDWIRLSPRRMRDRDAGRMIKDACEVLKSAASPDVIHHWLRTLD